MLSDTGNCTHTHTHIIIIIVITQVCYLIQVTAHRHIITVESESERTLNEVLADLRNKIPPPMTFLAKEKILHTVTMGYARLCTHVSHKHNLAAVNIANSVILSLQYHSTTTGCLQIQQKLSRARMHDTVLAVS